MPSASSQHRRYKLIMSSAPIAGISWPSMNPTARRLFLLGSGGFLIGLLAGILAMFVTSAYTSGFSGADESAHFLNSYFISSYLKGHFGTNPLGFATDFYIHYPKISIGHWPPAYYGFVGLLFLIVPATVQSALLINLILSALPAAFVAITLGYLMNRRAALLGAAVYALTPLAVEGQAYFMLDQVLAAICIAATMAWCAYVAKPAWWRAFLFAAFCVLAILTKGNGWLLVFVPIYHTLLTRNWRLLALPHVYGAALAAGVLVLPWYWLTSGISAEGFNYQAGLDYAVTAFSASIQHLADNLGLPAILLAALAVIVEFRHHRHDGLRWSVSSACLSLVLAALTLQSLVPVDIVPRYMAPALPALLVLAIMGLSQVYASLSHRQLAAGGVIAACLLIGFMFAPGIRHLATRTAKPDYQMANVIPLLATSLPHDLCLIDGVSNAEGAFMAEMAIRDTDLRHYAIRGSKLFADTNFMGTRYAPRFTDARAMLAEVMRLGIHNVIVVRVGNEPAFPHSRQLVEALQLSESPFKRVAVLPHGSRSGTTEVYASAIDRPSDLEAVRQQGIPTKVSNVIKPQL